MGSLRSMDFRGKVKALTLDIVRIAREKLFSVTRMHNLPIQLL